MSLFRTSALSVFWLRSGTRPNSATKRCMGGGIRTGLLTGIGIVRENITRRMRWLFFLCVMLFQSPGNVLTQGVTFTIGQCHTIHSTKRHSSLLLHSAYSSATDHLKLHLPNSYTPQDWKTAKKELKDASERFVEDELRAHGALEDYEEAPAPPQVPEPTEDVHAEPLPTPIVELHNDDASGPHDDEYDDELVFEDQQFTGPIHPPFVDANSDKANDATKTQAASPEFKIDFDFPTQAEDDFDPFPVVPGPQLTEHKELPHGDVYLNEPFALADEAPDSPVLVPLDTMPDDFLVPEPALTQVAGQKRDRDDTDDEELSYMDGEEQQRDERPSYEVTSPMKRRRFNEF